MDSSNSNSKPQVISKPLPPNNSYQNQQSINNASLFGLGNIQNNIQQPQTYIFGQNQQPTQYTNMIFNDDEPIIEKVKEEKKEQAKIKIDIKAQRTMVKLKTESILPAMCSITAEGGERTSVDLICVIDVSSSMSGQKIALVKQTMKYLLETLTPSDRLSIITFNHIGQRVCGLKTVSNENLVQFHNFVQKLFASGSTAINQGLQLGLKTIRDRKYQNTVTSIFLLSDGQDKGADANFQIKLAQPINKELPIFSIHSFGFGSDHDEDLMTNICEQRDGSFYYIKQLSTLDEAFCNALGGIISTAASEVMIKLNNISKNIVEGIRINKTYGNMWEKINDKEYKIKLLQLMSGVSKDHIFELQIPCINTEVGDLDRNHDVIEAIFMAKGFKGENITGQCCLKLTLLNVHEEIPEMNQNVQVTENYLRVHAAEAIRQNTKLADNGQYEAAQKGIQKMIGKIQESKKARPQKMQHLVEDLQEIKEKCKPKVYEYQGKKAMKYAEYNHYKQAPSKPSYQNTNQMAMKYDMMEKKK